MDLLNESGVGERLRREGLVHHGIELRFNQKRHRIDMHELTGGPRDHGLCAARGGEGSDSSAVSMPVDRSLFDAVMSVPPRFRGRVAAHPSCARRNERHEVVLGFYRWMRRLPRHLPAFDPRTTPACYEKTYPFGWLGIPAAAPPASHEVIYSNHERGFALLSMRLSKSPAPICSAGLTRILRPGLTSESGKNSIALRDPRGFSAEPGRNIQKGVTPMRSFVTEPMQYGRLFLAGDAAHMCHRRAPRVLIWRSPMFGFVVERSPHGIAT